MNRRGQVLCVRVEGSESVQTVAGHVPDSLTFAVDQLLLLDNVALLVNVHRDYVALYLRSYEGGGRVKEREKKG